MLLVLLFACPHDPSDTAAAATDTGADTGGDTAPETGQDTDSGGDTDSGADTAEKLTFGNTLYPVWSEDCGGCHGGWGSVGDPEALLQNMLTNGKDGPPIVAGDRAASAVYLKLLEDGGGLEGKRMPLVLDHLSEAQVAEFGAWIDAGAANDSTWSGLFRITWEERKCGMCHQEWGGFRAEDVHAYITTNSVYGGPLVKPGDAASSLVYQRLSSSAAPEDRMPQVFDYVDDATIERIGQWIDEGAVYE